MARKIRVLVKRDLIELSGSLEYLMVELVDNECGGQRDNFNDIRNLDKRRQQD
ncbi:5268_t:CDS:2 [Racocetra fulgida]|uniref:5268_t:CDS:1 n=1 Tax=Racocetra fulgida TaxID=60492 RepID=A0A9N8W9T6_9GLOM|nr:5268_t:CDS:2 [Racocetra fulgida]